MDVRTFVMLVLLLLPAGLAAGLAKLQIDAFRTRRWRRVEGRVLSSRLAARDVKTQRHSYSRTGDVSGKFITQEEVARRHFAEIEYEYVVDGRALRGRRVGLGADGGDFEIVETLRRYPPGAVVSVFCDPRDPESAILERPSLGRFLMGWFGVSFLAAVIVGAVYGVDGFARVIRAVAPRPERTPLIVFLAGFSAALTVFALMLAHGGRRAKAWPRTQGRIVVSRVETRLRTERISGAGGARRITMYTPRVIYAYEVGGVGFQGENVGWIASSNRDDGPKKAAARWPVGTPVLVFYNPENPTDSTLRPGAGLLPPIVGALAITFAVAAGWLAGL